ncbi:MAG TPA: LuxR C-terminal-related transcriptional regulator [Bacteroidales bacterium]|nr:LuxR C-terminal-related transcriptional regulator [Bacteroidales bacterium]
MIRLVALLIFIISVASTAGSIILSSKLRNKYNHEVFSSLFYYLVFIFTFGFYSIWGQVVIKAYLENISPELLSRITDITTLFGFPFLVIAWLMLIRLACSLAGMKFSNLFITIYLVINLSAITIPGFLLSDTQRYMPTFMLKIYYIVMNIIYSFTVCYIIMRGKGKGVASIDSHDRKMISSLVAAILVIQSVPLLLYEGQVLLGLIFILLFFTGNSFFPVYLTYGAGMPERFEAKQIIPGQSLESFCHRYEISPREKDIIREICNGLSNKEISEKLFISLQTVKDHTHRIYLKVNVKSRMQLMNLVKGIDS